MFEFWKLFSKDGEKNTLKKDSGESDERPYLLEYGSLITEKQSFPVSKEALSLWNVRKSIVLLMVGTGCLYSAVDANMNIVSSIASKDGLSSVALIVYGVVQVVNSLLANAYMPLCLSRYALFASMFALTLYIIGNIDISWITFIIAAVLQGFGYSLQWIAGSVYNTEIGHYYANLISDDPQSILVRIFGVFNAAVQSGFLFGNIAVYFVLSDRTLDKPFPSVNASNTSYFNSSDTCDVCGALFYEEEAEKVPQLERPSQSQLQELTCIFAILSLIGCSLITFMDDFGEKSKVSFIEGFRSFGIIMKKIFWQVFDFRMILLFPITLFIGMEQAYIMTEFTMAFVGCCLGISQIGIIMICFGAVDVITCLIQEFVVRIIGRKLVIAFGIVAGIMSLFVLLLWQPTREPQSVYYFLAALWALMDSVLITQIFAIYSLLFKDDANAAFSVAILWVSTGFLLPFCYSFPLVQKIKLIIMISVLVAGCMGYAILEIKLSFQSRLL